MLQRAQPAAVVCKACLQRCSVRRASAARLQSSANMVSLPDGSMLRCCDSAQEASQACSKDLVS